MSVEQENEKNVKARLVALFNISRNKLSKPSWYCTCTTRRACRIHRWEVIFHIRQLFVQCPTVMRASLRVSGANPCTRTCMYSNTVSISTEAYSNSTVWRTYLINSPSLLLTRDVGVRLPRPIAWIGELGCRATWNVVLQDSTSSTVESRNQCRRISRNVRVESSTSSYESKLETLPEFELKKLAHTGAYGSSDRSFNTGQIARATDPDQRDPEQEPATRMCRPTTGPSKGYTATLVLYTYCTLQCIDRIPTLKYIYCC